MKNIHRNRIHPLVFNDLIHVIIFLDFFYIVARPPNSYVVSNLAQRGANFS